MHPHLSQKPTIFRWPWLSGKATRSQPQVNDYPKGPAALTIGSDVQSAATRPDLVVSDVDPVTWRRVDQIKIIGSPD